MRLTRWRLVLFVGFLFLSICSGSVSAQAPSITSLSPTSGPVGTLVTISGSNFGATQGSSTIALDGTTATVVSWAAVSITAIVPSGASSGSFSVTVNGTPASSSSFTITALPSGWSDGDVGSVGVAGSATYANGIFTANGSGVGISTTADGLNFVSQPLSGNGTIIARVVSVQGSSTQAGVMIRQTLAANSIEASTYVQSSYIYFNDRTSTGGNGGSWGSQYQPTLPYWVELVCNGSTFSSYYSPDGVSWTQLGSSQTISMGANVYVGLVVSSESNSSLATATFDNVSISSAASPAPVITSLSATTGPIGSQVTVSGSGFGSSQGSSVVTLNDAPVTINSWSATSIGITIPSGATSGLLVVSVAPSMNDSNPVEFAVTMQPLPTTWVDQDLGTVGVTGSATFSNGVYTIQGSGTGIGGTVDEVHFVYQPLSGNGTIVARVVSVQGSSTQAGVMIRQTLAANSMDASTYVQSSYIYFNDRASTGGNGGSWGSQHQPTLPYWVELVCNGSTFSSYYSPDGVSWMQLGSSQTISMGENVYVGLVVSSESNSSLATATFDNVSVSSTASPAPIISGVSPAAGVIGTQATISGSGFGSTQGSSLVILNGTLLTASTWSATAVTVTIPSGATSGPLVVSVAPSMNDSNPFTFLIGTQLLSTWMDVDIGTVGLAGSATYANGTFTAKGSGTGISQATDGLNFLFQSLSGDGTIVARVVSVQGSGAQAGVMIRETLSPSSTVGCTCYSNYMYFYYRATTGSNVTYQGNSAIPSLPYWVKLSRVGSTFSSYLSPDGINWTQLESSETITMAQSVNIGLVVSSDSNSSLATATFDNVSISTASSPAPVITGLSATTGPVGTEVVISGSGFGASQGSSTVTLNGALTTIGYWSNTSIVITIPSGATSGPLLVSVAPSMNDSNYAIFNVTTQPLPNTWLDQDVGAVGVKGSATYSNGIFTVQGSGTGVGGTADGVHFVYQPLSGDGTIIARVISVQNSSTQAGVMIRETLNPGATDAFELYSSYMYFYYRTSTGGSVGYNGNTGIPGLPYWVKLVRSGNTFSA